MKIEQSNVVTFRPLTITIETKAEADKVYLAAHNAYIAAKSNSEAEGFYQALRDELGAAGAYYPEE